jgi:hypothetical protein
LVAVGTSSSLTVEIEAALPVISFTPVGVCLKAPTIVPRDGALTLLSDATFPAFTIVEPLFLAAPLVTACDAIVYFSIFMAEILS